MISLGVLNYTIYKWLQYKVLSISRITVPKSLVQVLKEASSIITVLSYIIL